jgi:hypothetical protein
MKNTTLSLLIVTLAAVAACNRTTDKAPSTAPQASASSVPPSVNQPSSGATQPNAPSSSAGSSNVQGESSSKELSKQEESTGQPRPGTGGADHSSPAREPGAKG